jgi:hypothetical protein
MIWNVKSKKAAKSGDWAVTGIDGNHIGLCNKWVYKHNLNYIALQGVLLRFLTYYSIRIYLIVLTISTFHIIKEYT